MAGCGRTRRERARRYVQNPCSRFRWCSLFKRKTWRPGDKPARRIFHKKRRRTKTDRRRRWTLTFGGLYKCFTYSGACTIFLMYNILRRVASVRYEGSPPAPLWGRSVASAPYMRRPRWSAPVKSGLYPGANFARKGFPSARMLETELRDNQPNSIPQSTLHGGELERISLSSAQLAA